MRIGLSIVIALALPAIATGDTITVDCEGDERPITTLTGAVDQATL